MTLEELETSCKRTVEFWTADSPTSQSAAAILGLIAEVRALREDAERYQTIRNRGKHWKIHGRQNVMIGMWEEDLDAAIDMVRGSK